MEYLMPLDCFDFLKTLIKEPPSLEFSSTLLILVLTVFSSNLIRLKLLSLFFKYPQMIVVHVIDATISFEYFVISFELGVIYEEFGYWWWMLALFVSVVYQLILWQGLSMPSPAVYIQEYFYDRASPKVTITRIVVSGFTGFITLYCYSLPLWARRTSLPLIKDRIEAMNGTSCLMDLDEMSIVGASITEFIGTVILTMAPPMVFDHPILFISGPMTTTFLIGFITCGVISFGLPISGGFYNPVLTLITFYNCKNFSLINHILIYWIPGLSASVVAYYSYQRARTHIYNFFDIVLRNEKKWYQSSFTILNRTHLD